MQIQAVRHSVRKPRQLSVSKSNGIDDYRPQGPTKDSLTHLSIQLRCNLDHNTVLWPATITHHPNTLQENLLFQLGLHTLYFAESSGPGPVVDAVEVDNITNAIWYDSDGRNQKSVEVDTLISLEGNEGENDYLKRIVDSQAIKKYGSSLLAEAIDTLRSGGRGSWQK